MWFEILPSFGIIVGILSVPGIGIYYLNKVTNGNPFKRDMLSHYDRRLYQRDMRLTGDPYKCNGLDAIPDK